MGTVNCSGKETKEAGRGGMVVRWDGTGRKPYNPFTYSTSN